MTDSINNSQQVKINPDEIPQTDYDIGCSILVSCIRRFFEQPGIRKEYEEWLKSEDAKRFSKQENASD